MTVRPTLFLVSCPKVDGIQPVKQRKFTNWSNVEIGILNIFSVMISYFQILNRGFCSLCVCQTKFVALYKNRFLVKKYILEFMEERMREGRKVRNDNNYEKINLKLYYLCEIVFSVKLYFLTLTSISFNLEFNRSRLCTNRCSSMDSEDGF
jgi:hypothetical protein